MASITKDEAEAFLYHEAEILDQRRLEEWLDLFTEDGLYFLPIDEGHEASEGLALIRDDSIRRRERVFRLLHTSPPSQDPVSRTQHFVSNVRVESGPGELVTVRSAQLICEIRRGGGDYRQLGLGMQQTIAAACEHRLERREDGWRIALKKMVLLNRDVPIPGLSFLL